LPGSGLERDPRFHLWNFAKHAIDRVDNFFEAGFFAGAKVRAGMQDQKRQLKLISAREFFGQRAD
jgi:hypothetical protein